MNDAWVSRSLMVSKPPFAHSAMPMSLKSCFLFFWTCLRSWEAALCSAGSKVRVHKMSSRNSMVRFFKLWFPSKSFKKKFTLVLGHEDEDGKRAQSVKVSLSCHLSVLGDPVPQDGKHPHGRRRTRDGHLPPCRLPKWVGGGVLRQYLFLWYKPTALATLTALGRSRGLLEPAVAAANATAAGAKLDLEKISEESDIKSNHEDTSCGPVSRMLSPHQVCSHSEK